MASLQKYYSITYNITVSGYSFSACIYCITTLILFKYFKGFIDTKGCQFGRNNCYTNIQNNKKHIQAFKHNKKAILPEF